MIISGPIETSLENLNMRSLVYENKYENEKSHIKVKSYYNKGNNIHIP